jgi:peptidoglycan/LPS O-acetylase OafA/YrhL
MSTSERLDVLDGFRGFAIALVVVYHEWLVSGQALGWLNFIVEAGFFGVDLFFFISGFCLFYPYARAMFDGRRQPGTRRFYERRALKIVPSYLLAIAVFAIVYRGQFSSAKDAALQVFAHLTFLHTLSTSTFGSISGPLWTIGIEVQFYLIFPLVALAFRRFPLAGYLALIVLSESYRVGIGALGLGTSFLWINQLPAFLDVFGAGMFAAYALLWLRARRMSIRTISSAVAAAAFGLTLAALAAASRVNATTGVDAAHGWLNAHRVLIGPLCLVLALSTSFASKALRGLVASRAIVFLSAISYNLYLWHLEIAVWFHNAGFRGPSLYAYSLVASIAFACLITYRLEQPLLRADLAALIGSIRERFDSRRGVEPLERAA